MGTGYMWELKEDNDSVNNHLMKMNLNENNECEFVHKENLSNEGNFLEATVLKDGNVG